MNENKNIDDLLDELIFDKDEQEKVIEDKEKIVLDTIDFECSKEESSQTKEIIKDDDIDYNGISDIEYKHPEKDNDNNNEEYDFIPITKAEYNKTNNKSEDNTEERNRIEEYRSNNLDIEFKLDRDQPPKPETLVDPDIKDMRDKMTGGQKFACFCSAFFFQVIGVTLNILVFFKNKKGVVGLSITGMLSGIFTFLALPFIMAIILFVSLPPEYTPYDYNNDVNIIYSQELKDKIPEFSTADDFINFYDSLSIEDFMILEKYPVSYKDYWEAYYKRYDWHTIEFIEGNNGEEYLKEYSWNIDDDNKLDYVVVKGHDSNNEYYFDMSDEGNDLVYSYNTDSFDEIPYIDNKSLSV